MADAQNGPFTRAAAAWLDILERAKAVKNQRFGPDAEEGVRFYCSDVKGFFDSLTKDRRWKMPGKGGDSDIIISYNKAAEMVQIFGPELYHNNPTRRVTTRTPPDIDPNLFVRDQQSAMQVQQMWMASQQEQMMDKALSALFENLLNVTPDKLDLKGESRKCIDEMLLKGLGVSWSDYKVAPGTGRKMCGTFYDSVDNFLMDPEAKDIKDIKWCSRTKLMHRWEAERKWHIPQGILQGTHFSANGLSSSGTQPAGVNYDATMKPDLVEVTEIWSKMGVGGRLPQCQYLPAEFRAAYDVCGDFCYMVVVKGHPWPLNLPPWMFKDVDPIVAFQDAQRAVQWPTPYWLLEGGWPFTPYYVHTVPNEAWPMSHLSPAMGELKFLNWAFGKIASKIAVTSRDMLFVDDSIGEQVEQAILYGVDLTKIKVKELAGKKIEDIVKFFQHPEWNPDLWKVMDAVSNAFDQRVGLSELLYGQSERQMRSAEEASQKYKAASSRITDMANKVEDAAGHAASLEMLCSRWHYTDQDVASLSGIAAGFAWSMLCVGQPVERILDLQARVEEDSSRKPNKGSIADGLQQAFQTLGQPLFVAAQAGMMDPWNAMVGDYIDSLGIPGKQRYLLQAQPVAPVPEDPNRTADREADNANAEADRKVAAKKKAA